MVEPKAAGRVTPATAPRLAEESVAFVEEKFGFRLPYTPESFILVDALIEKVKATGATERQVPSLLVGLGCYVGEVLVRHARASWRGTAEMGMAASCRFPIVLALPGRLGCDAIGRVFQRFNGGPADDLALFYETLVRPDPRRTDSERR